MRSALLLVPLLGAATGALAKAPAGPVISTDDGEPLSMMDPAPPGPTVQWGDTGPQARWADVVIDLDSLCDYADGYGSTGATVLAGGGVLVTCTDEDYEPVKRSFVLRGPTSRWSVEGDLEARWGGRFFLQGGDHLLDAEGRTLWKRPAGGGHVEVRLDEHGVATILRVEDGPGARRVHLERVGVDGEVAWSTVLPFEAGPYETLDSGPAVDVSTPVDLATVEHESLTIVAWPHMGMDRWTRVLVIDDEGTVQARHRYLDAFSLAYTSPSGSLILEPTNGGNIDHLEVAALDDGRSIGVDLREVVPGLTGLGPGRLHARYTDDAMAFFTDEELVVVDVPSWSDPGTWRPVLRVPMEERDDIRAEVTLDGNEVVFRHGALRRLSLDALRAEPQGVSSASVAPTAPRQVGVRIQEEERGPVAHWPDGHTVSILGDKEGRVARWSDGRTVALGPLCPNLTDGAEPGARFSPDGLVVLDCREIDFDDIERMVVLVSPDQHWAVSHALSAHPYGFFSRGGSQLFDREGRTLWRRPVTDAHEVVRIGEYGRMTVLRAKAHGGGRGELVVDVVDATGAVEWARTLAIPEGLSGVFDDGPAVVAASLLELDVRDDGGTSVVWFEWPRGLQRSWDFDAEGSLVHESEQWKEAIRFRGEPRPATRWTLTLPPE